MNFKEEIINILLTVNRSAVQSRELKPDDDLFKLGIIDSLTIVQVIVAIEKKYTIKISSKDINYNSFTTIESIEKLLSTKLKENE